VLFCADAWESLARVLLVDQGDHGNERFLRTAVELCRRLEAAPLVLTVARSERAARARQQIVQATLADCNREAGLDYITGYETRVAIAHVARWRRCQLVVLEQRASAPWWRWLRDTSTDWLAELAESLTFLALPRMELRKSDAEPPILASVSNSLASHELIANSKGNANTRPVAR
jgi:K+-sensing histidine kinase KdpD